MDYASYRLSLIKHTGCIAHYVMYLVEPLNYNFFVLHFYIGSICLKLVKLAYPKDSTN